MRSETQHWDKIKATLEVVTAGVGATGKAPTCAVQRLTDGQYLQAGGGSWAAGFATNALTEIDAVNLPGAYTYSVPTARLTYAQGITGYRVKIVEGTTPILEYVDVVGSRSERDEALSWGTVVAGSVGEELLIINALRQNNTRVIYDTWDATGKPTHGKVYVYVSKAALEADVTPWAGAIHSWEFDAAYDVSGRVTLYTSTRES